MSKIEDLKLRNIEILSDSQLRTGSSSGCGSSGSGSSG